MKVIEIIEGKKVHRIEQNQICFFEAAGNNTLVRLIDKTSIRSTKTLKYYHELFHEKGFFRVNRKHLVNLEHIISVG